MLLFGLMFCAHGALWAASPSASPPPESPEAGEDARHAGGGHRVGAPVREADPSAVLPGITIDREAGYVDVEAEVVNRDVKWLELLLCEVGGREHETILATEARPSHVHLSLILLGLKPGRVQRGEPIDPDDPEAGYRIIPSQGPAVRVELFYHEPAEKLEDAAEPQRGGKAERAGSPAGERDTRSEPDAEPADSGSQGPAESKDAEPQGPLQRVQAGAWVYDRTAEQTLAGQTWLFTGSRFAEHEGKRVYVADFTGTLISLVNFGDDVLAPRNDLTNRTDEQAMGAHTPAIPPVGTPVTVRLTPVAQDPAGRGDAAE